MNIHTGPDPQRGSTLIGFIAGLLVGLAVALVVAAYVTKVPVPLMDRNVQQAPISASVDDERNRDWNPNAHLSNRPAAAAPAPAPAATDLAVQPSPLDPLGQLIEQQSGAAVSAVATVEAPALVDPFIYYVQVGAFRSAAEAQSQRARLGLLGLEATLSERQQAGQPVFRVRIGPFDRRVDAEVMEQRVKAQGMETALVRVQR